MNSPNDDLPLIELGVIVAGTLEAIDRDAATKAVESLNVRLSKMNDRFDWRLPQIRRVEWVDAARIEPVELLAQAREQRDTQGWDFAVVLTGADLISHYKPITFGVISRSLDVAVISTSRIDPLAFHDSVSDEQRVKQLAIAIENLVLHAIGHWTGLNHHPDRDNVMHESVDAEPLVDSKTFTPVQQSSMSEKFSAISDQRLEERLRSSNDSNDANKSRGWLTRFALQATWENRAEIASSLRQAKPWEFPARLSRFATAAISTVLVLLMTGETWDMAMNQTWASVTVLLLFAITLTASFICVRQQLLVRRNNRRLTEQMVATNVSAVLIVVCGILTMYGLLFLFTLAASVFMFPKPVAMNWASSLDGPLATHRYFLLAGTVSSLGILIGALGASFEDQSYFRHVIFVDEEI